MDAEYSHGSNAQLLASAIVTHARDLKAPLIVLKEFPARYREPLNCFLHHGFSRVPSLPMTRLNIDYPSFDAYMARALNSATRRKLRKKFAAAALASRNRNERSMTMSLLSLMKSIHSTSRYTIGRSCILRS